MASGNGNGIAEFFRGVTAEVRKITWPTAEEIRKTVLAVALVCLIYVLLSGLSDVIINLFFSLLKTAVAKIG